MRNLSNLFNSETKNKSLDKNINFLKHVFINFIFVKAVQDTFHKPLSFLSFSFFLLFLVDTFSSTVTFLLNLSIYQILQSVVCLRGGE